MNPTWHVRPYQPGDETALLSLFEQTFGWRMTVAQWRWKLFQQPLLTPTTSVATVWIAADAENRPIGHYCGLPHRLAIAGSTVAVIHATDAMTDARYRRQGVFTALMSTAHRAWSEAGFVGVIGLPIATWGSRIDAFDWRPEAALRWRLRPLRPAAIMARRLGIRGFAKLTGPEHLWNMLADRRLGPAAALTVTTLESGLDGTLNTAQADALDAIDEQSRADGRAAMVRGAAWVAWRYLTCPLHRYTAFLAHDGDRPRGFAAMRIDPGPAAHAYLADLCTHAEDSTARRVLVRAAVAHARAHNAVAIASLTPAGPERDTLVRGGFVLPRRRGYWFRCVPLVDSPPWLHPTTHWRLTGGEFDVV